MDTESAVLELTGLSKALRMFHDEQSPPDTDSGFDTEMWLKFFRLHIQIAEEKTHDSLFQPWKIFLNESLNKYEVIVQNPESKTVYFKTDLDISGESTLHKVIRKSVEVITSVVSYHKDVAQNQLDFLDRNGISFSLDYLSEALDYYTFWRGKFDKVLSKEEHNDVDVVILMDSIKLFWENHEAFQNTIIQWPLPMGCHYPNLDDSLEMFFSVLPPVPTPKYSSSAEVRNLPLITSKLLVQEEYSKATEYLISYFKQFDMKCGVIFPTPGILDNRYKKYRLKLDEEIRMALTPVKTTCAEFEKAKLFPGITFEYTWIDNAIAAVTSAGRLLLCVKRKLKEVVARFLLFYYNDVKKNMKKNKNVLKRMQGRKTTDLTYMFQIRNRLAAYKVWKEALNRAICDVKNGRLAVLSNVYLMEKFYFQDFLNEAKQLDLSSNRSIFNSFLK